jgi:hypothetical protein
MIPSTASQEDAMPAIIKQINSEMGRVGVRDLFDVRDVSACGKYIMLGSGDEAWCHDAQVLLEALRGMDDDQYAASDPSDMEEAAERNSDFCDATGNGYSAAPPAGLSWEQEGAWWSNP